MRQYNTFFSKRYNIMEQELVSEFNNTSEKTIDNTQNVDNVQNTEKSESNDPQKSDINKSKIERKNLITAINLKYFVTSVGAVTDLVTKKSLELEQEKILSINATDEAQSKKMDSFLKAHAKLRQNCNDIKSGFTASLAQEYSDFDHGKIIKKIYKVLTTNMDKLYPTPDISIFSLTNENKEIVTIIPGINISLIHKHFSDEDLNIMWTHLYMLYISSVGMISVSNDHKKNKLIKLLPDLQKKVVEFGVLTSGEIFNPFVGVSSMNDGEIDVEQLFAGIDKMDKPQGLSVEDMLGMAGFGNLDGLLDIDKINSELRNIKQEDITTTAQAFTQLLGADPNGGVSEVCGTLIENIVHDLKEKPNAGVKDIFSIAANVGARVGPTVGKQKMKETAGKLNDFLMNGEKNLEKMTDKDGNPIGDKIKGALDGPLKFLRNFQKGMGGKQPNPAEMLASMASMRSELEKEMSKGKSNKNKE